MISAHAFGATTPERIELTRTGVQLMGKGNNAQKNDKKNKKPKKDTKKPVASKPTGKM